MLDLTVKLMMLKGFFMLKKGNTLFRALCQTEAQAQAFALQVRPQMSHYMSTYMT